MTWVSTETTTYAAFLHSARYSMLIHWSPRVAPLVKTGLTISQHSESQLHESGFNWNNWGAFFGDVRPHRRKNEYHTCRSFKIWLQKGAIWFIQSGKDLLSQMNECWYKFSPGCSAVTQTVHNWVSSDLLHWDSASDLIWVHWSQQSAWIHTLGAAMAMAMAEAKIWI